MKKRIVGADETVVFTPAGELQRIAVYRYTLDDLGPFEYRVPVERDTVEGLKEAMRKKEEIIQAVMEEAGGEG